MRKSHSLLLSCLLLLASANAALASDVHNRALLPGGDETTTGTSTTPTVTPPTTPTTPNTPSSNPTPSTPSTPPTTPTDTSSKPESTPSNTATNNTNTNPTPTNNTPTPPPSSPSQPSAPGPSTPTGGEVVITATNTLSGTSSTPTPSNTSKPEDDSPGGFGTGSIIGVSIAGGVAVIGIIGFFVWKFTRKRHTDFDDNEQIKWPELNAHGGNPDSHPLPVHNTGRSGFETASEADLSRVPSTSNYSHPDLNAAGGQDPYAVPPLPHMNPNQPYRDDPHATATGYYDPYRGPVPGTLEHGADDYGHENIPMTQMAAGTGRMSPGPGVAYGAGRASPGPHAAYAEYDNPYTQNGRGSPAPQAPYAGRASPGPQHGYDYYGGR